MEYHPCVADTIVSCGKSQISFWTFESGSLSRKFGLFDVRTSLVTVSDGRLIANFRQTLQTTTKQQTHSSFSRMRVINHNWSATKQRLHPQGVAEISRHSVLSGDRIRQCETSSLSLHKDTRSVSRHFLLQAPQCPSFNGRFSMSTWVSLTRSV